MAEPNRNLTPARRRCLEALARLTERLGYPPTTREIGAELGASPNAAHELLVCLELRGLISRTPGRARTTRITDAGACELARGKCG